MRVWNFILSSETDRRSRRLPRFASPFPSAVSCAVFTMDDGSQRHIPLTALVRAQFSAATGPIVSPGVAEPGTDYGSVA